MEYDEGFERDVLNDPSLLFKVDYKDDKGQDVHEEYIRCGGVKHPYQAAVKTMQRRFSRLEVLGLFPRRRDRRRVNRTISGMLRC